VAGIGFELRKIYGRKTLASSVWGSIYATMTTIGPSVLFAILLLTLKFFMDDFEIQEIRSMFFISSFTYIFLVAVLVASLFNTILSRYISDCIFVKKEDDICASMFGVLAMGSVVSGIIIFAFCLGMYFNDRIPIRFLIVYYWLGILATNTYNLINYVSALKKYKEVTISYLISLVVAIPTFLLLYKIFNVEIVFAAYIALSLGFFLANIVLVYCCVKAFGKPSDNYFSFLSYFKRFPKLLLSGFSYMLGFYISTIIYWLFSDMSTQVSIFRTAPEYDMAMFMAIVVNMPALVIFVVKVETEFFEKYVAYLSALNHGAYSIIEKERENMINIIRLQLFYVYEVQLIVTVVLICLVNVFFPYLGISAQSLNMFMILSMGLYCTFCMYFTVIFLYYFEDHTFAAIGPVIFLVLTTVLSLICSVIGKPFYTLPLLIGGIIGWVITYILLKKRLKSLNMFLLCK
jgi:polysaccharide biosynthesis protein PelG